MHISEAPYDGAPNSFDQEPNLIDSIHLIDKMGMDEWSKLDEAIFSIP